MKFLKLLTLIWTGGGNPAPCCISFNNPKTIKAVPWHFAAFSIISFVPNLVSLTRPSLQILGKIQTWVFPISGFLVNSLSDFHNSGSSYDIDMKLGPVTKLDMENLAASMSICDVIVIFLIYGPFGATWKPDSEGMVCKTYIFVNSNLLSCRN